MALPNYYEVLQVSPNADAEVIQAAYKRLALKYHPDRTAGDDHMMRQLNEAYEILSSPEKRSAYDASVKHATPGISTATSEQPPMSFASQLLTWLLPPIAPSVSNIIACTVLFFLVSTYIFTIKDPSAFVFVLFVGSTIGAVRDWIETRRRYKASQDLSQAATTANHQVTSWGSLSMTERRRLIMRWTMFFCLWLAASVAYMLGWTSSHAATEEFIQHFKQAEYHYKQKEFGQAIQEYTKAIYLAEKQVPQNTEKGNQKILAAMYENRGLSYVGIRDHLKAIEDFDQAIKLTEDVPFLFYWRGRSHYLNQNYKQATSDCNRAITLDKTMSLAYVLRADICLLQKEFDQALTDYNEAIKFGIKSANIYEGRSIANRAKGNLTRADDDLQQANRLRADQGK